MELAGQGTDTLDFSAISGALTFTFNGTAITVVNGLNSVSANNDVENVIGGSGSNTFALQGNTVIAGKIDGGVGGGTLDFSVYGTAHNLILTTLGTTLGFRGTEPSIQGGFDNITALMGTSFNDSLTGLDAPATWHLNLGGALYQSTNSLGFTSIETLKGGSASDTFSFANGAAFTGSFVGGAGSDLLDYSAYLTPVTVNLSTGVVQGVSGTVTAIENITGGSGADILTGDNNPNVLSGLGGDDHLFGLGGADTLIGGAGNDQLSGGMGDDRYIFARYWGIDEVFENGGEGADTMDFTAVPDDLTITIASVHVTDGVNFADHNDNNIEIVRAGLGNDTFRITNGVPFGGTLDGMIGSDTLDLNGYTTPVNVVLTGLGATDGFSGTGTGVGAFTDMDVLLGGSAPAGDSLTGANLPSTFELDGSDRYISGGRNLGFSGFETLNGGSGQDIFDLTGAQTFDLNGGAGDDLFTFANGATLTGKLDGGLGSNTLDFSRYDTSRDVYLTGTGSQTGFNGSESAILGSFANITSLNGSSSTDSLTGLNVPSVWNINGLVQYTASGRSLLMVSTETLNGGAFEDRFIFANGATLPGNIDGSGGKDTVDFSAYTTDLWVDLDTGAVEENVTWNILIGGGVSSVENFLAGSGNDMLFGNSKDNLLDGGAGDDWIDGGDGNDVIYTGSGNNILFGGRGMDTAYIAYGSTYEIRLNDIENLNFLLPPSPPPAPAPDQGESQQAAVSNPCRLLIIPVKSGDWTDLPCANCLTVALLLPDHNLVNFGSLSHAIASLTALTAADLPGALPENDTLVSSLRIDLKINGLAVLLSPHRMKISFAIPTNWPAAKLAILFWDQSLDNGSGGWVEIPSWLVDAWLKDGLDRMEGWIMHTGIYVLVYVN